MKDVNDIHPFGLLLGIEAETMKGIQSYYKDSHSMISLMTSMWLMSGPQDPVTQLKDTLSNMGKHEIAQQLVQLSSLSKTLAIE